MSPPREDAGEDQCVWGGEDNGRFTIKSAYRIVCGSPENSDSRLWQRVWKWKGPHRIRFFLWLTIQEKLLTNCNRVKRRMAADASCGWCQHSEESVLHILRDCNFAAESWTKLGGFDMLASHWQEDGRMWIRKGLKMENCLTFEIHCWLLG
ncbi:Putative ribonuclease H protein At1g65750 [Linum perenne]